MKCEHGGTQVVATCEGRPDVVIGCLHRDDGVIVAHIVERYSMRPLAIELMWLAKNEAHKQLALGNWPPNEDA